MTDNGYFPYAPYPQQFAEYWSTSASVLPSSHPVYYDQHQNLLPTPTTLAYIPHIPAKVSSLPTSISPVAPGASKRKARAIQACEQCRYRKQRCSEGAPCDFCKANELQCNYRPAFPSKTDKVVDTLLSWMTSHADGLQVLAEKIDNLETHFRATQCKDGKTDAVSYLARSNAMLLGSKAANLNTELDAEVDQTSSILLWPEVWKLLVASRVEASEDYVAKAEDRPVLVLDRVSHLQSPTTDYSPPYISNQTTDATLDAEEVNTFLAGFLQHVHPLQPFLDRKKLVIAANRILDKRAVRNSHNTSQENGHGHLRPPAKRRRIESPQEATGNMPIDRSPNKAIVLLALAIGATASHETTHGQPLKAERIPGLKYYARATTILSDHLDGTELTHAHLFLLAGMYKARLGRFSESSSWYSLAGRVILHLVQRHDLFSHWAKTSTPPLQAEEQILRAAWACILLERELLPELRPHLSNLHSLQEELLLPPAPEHNLTPETDGDATRTCRPNHLLQAQINLSIISHQIHRLLEEGDSLRQSRAELNTSIKILASGLQGWRSDLSSLISWDDKEPPPSDVQHARLRHESWTTKVSILRPFLDYVLHVLPGVKRGMPVEICSKNAKGRSRPRHQRHILSAVELMEKEAGESEIMRLAGLCVEAIKQSVVAFENCGNAVPAVNTVSLAHAQFHNVLMLGAVSKNEDLGYLIPTDTLRVAIDSTMELLERYASMSPTIFVDCETLRLVRDKVLGQQ